IHSLTSQGKQQRTPKRQTDPSKEVKMADETKEYYFDPESTESVDDDDDSSEPSSCDSFDNDNTVVDDSKLKTKMEFTEFEKTYLKMNDSDKWTLSTGKIVEDTLYNFGIKCRHEQDAIFKSQQWDSPYDRQTHFDHDWIRNTTYNLRIWRFIRKKMRVQIEKGRKHPCRFEPNNLVQIWIPEVDCSGIDRWTNRNRTGSAIVKMKRKIMGRREDLIIRKVSTEYGCSEAGKSFESNNGTKLLHERGIKAPKMMNVMFYSLCEAVENEEKKTIYRPPPPPVIKNGHKPL
ncbi:11749_t:CDS:2, partial [Gigaspora rosea]